MFILKPPTPVGEHIHSSLRSSHLKSKEQSTHSFLRPSNPSPVYFSNLCPFQTLPKQIRSLAACAFFPVAPPCLKGGACLPTALFPASATHQLYLPDPAGKTILGSLPQFLLASDQAPPAGELLVHMTVTLLLLAKMDPLLFIFVSPSAGNT